MSATFHSSLSKDLSLIFNDADDFNVIINVGDVESAKEFRAHSVILRARSPYFKSAFSADWIIKEDNIIIFNKPNITPTVFDMLLRYIYTGEINLSKQKGEDVLALLIASDELLLDELFQFVQVHLLERQISWVQQNFVLVLQTVFKLANCKALQDYCLESICANPQPFIASNHFLSLDKDILIGLLKRDDLQVEEIDAWDCLIQWGIKQIPDLESDRAKWDQKDFKALEKTLKELVPFIRFMEISPIEFYDKVRPYKVVIPNHICDEVEAFHYKKILPKIITSRPRLGRLESTIIKPKLVNIISNWIDKNDSAVLSSNNKYKFNLIYLKSRDGFDYKTFNNRCKGQGPFVVLIKVRSNTIYGGYNPIGYDERCQWVTSSASFIFSFENDQDIQNMEIGRVIFAKKAIYEHCNAFFNFGSHLFVKGRDLFLSNPGHYVNIFTNVDISLPIEEIEIFSIVKK
ncbi:19095_t:CDS:2 [Funneliformis geosporum]|uniref:19095_t:CDS:1 n=1 Tax=Funneliformis geosporum TaxID=1117311 RepID=A0A9W4T0H6_9GLOM|nr:19095_t:CDS:2 [Funneliformis geosporum]